MSYKYIEPTFFYIYKITNTLNGKIYIGQRASRSSPLVDNYFGSGKIIKSIIKKDGKINLKKDILWETEDENKLDHLERVMILLFKSTNRNIGYNITEGGRGTGIGEKSPKWGTKNSEEVRKKISEALSGKAKTQEHKNKLSQSRIESNKKYNRKPFLFGKKLTDEQKKKLLFKKGFVMPKEMMEKRKRTYHEQMNKNRENKGIYFLKRINRYRLEMFLYGKSHVFIGTFKTKEEAMDTRENIKLTMRQYS